VWQYYLIKAISKPLCLFPAWGRALVARVLGWLVWLAIPRWRKRLAIDQVRKCLGLSEKEAGQISKESGLQYGQMLVEILCFPLLTKDNIKKKVTFPGEEDFRKLFSGGKGIILATAHFGNWELLGAALSLYGYAGTFVAQKLHNSAVDRFINEYRHMTGAHITYKTGVLEMARLAEEGFVVGLAADQHGGRNGVMVDFLGQPSSCPKGPAALARLKKIPLVLSLLQPRADGQYEIYVSKPIPIEHSQDREKDIKEATTVLMQMLGEEIKKTPAMWFWLHNRWKAERAKYKNA
jgi:KDO2-lipid IV(A) lauroyltransferase